jgi:hypothetical protein
MTLKKPLVRPCACLSFHNFRINGEKDIEFKMIFISKIELKLNKVP